MTGEGAPDFEQNVKGRRRRGYWGRGRRKRQDGTGGAERVQGFEGQAAVNSREEQVKIVKSQDAKREGGGIASGNAGNEQRPNHVAAALAKHESSQPVVRHKADDSSASEQEDGWGAAGQCVMRWAPPQSMPLELNVGGKRFTTSLQTLIGADSPLGLL